MRNTNKPRRKHNSDSKYYIYIYVGAYDVKDT